MSPRTDSYELFGLRLSSGEGRRLDLDVDLGDFDLGGEHYDADSPVSARLDVSSTNGNGYALRLRFTGRLRGPCMRCLTAATPEFPIDAWEIWEPDADDELQSPYVAADGVLDLRRWAHDGLALALPAQILCRPDCAGLCAVCGVDLNAAPADHHHEAGPDPRWAKLSELRFD
jgi:uncharacterized protein